MSDTGTLGDHTPKQHAKHSQLEPFKWKPGVSPNPKGRPKGARSKLGEQFVQALQEDFEEHGPEVIKRVREERPQDYLKVLASILPKELTVNSTALGEMSDDELAGTLLALRDLALTLDVAIAGTGGENQGRTQSASVIQPVQ